MKKSDMYKLMVKTMVDNLPDLNNINILDIATYMHSVLDAVEEAGMLPPTNRKIKELSILDKYPNLFHYRQDRNAIVYKPGHWKVKNAPDDVRKYIKTVNYGDYSISYLKVGDSHEWQNEDE